MSDTVALCYQIDAYSVARNDIKGRHSAGAGFLSGVARYLPGDPIFCYAASRQAASHCAEAVAKAAGRPRPIRFVPYGGEAELAEAGCLFLSGPNLESYAWQRRMSGSQRGYSLCGLTHTICSEGVMDGFGQYLLAPLQPWDALVCTSSVARDAIAALLERWADYLGSRLGARPPAAPLRLPVIPLGVDCDRFDAGPEAERRRGELRRSLGIAADDVALLFFGRLSFHAKAHPLAMLQAAEAAARRLGGKRLHFLFVGRFPNDAVAGHYAAAAKACAPSVTVHFLDGADDALASGAWFAADIFLSLSDNIQETFGLTPIEAQAAGLPAVVTDWDGYKDTVADGETGFRVATTVPAADSGAGLDLMRLHAVGALSYDRYIGAASLCAAVDIAACADALVRLAEDESLRARMGAAARRRARERYDWRAVIGQYRALWAELAEIRAGAAEVAPPAPGMPLAPLRDDPFRVFANFPSRALSDDAVLSVAADCLPLAQALALDMNTYAAQAFLATPQVEQLVATVQQRPARVGDLLRAHAAPQTALRTLLWLIKLDVLRVRENG